MRRNSWRKLFRPLFLWWQASVFSVDACPWIQAPFRTFQTLLRDSPWRSRCPETSAFFIWSRRRISRRRPIRNFFQNVPAENWQMSRHSSVQEISLESFKYIKSGRLLSVSRKQKVFVSFYQGWSGISGSPGAFETALSDLFRRGRFVFSNPSRRDWQHFRSFLRPFLKSVPGKGILVLPSNVWQCSPGLYASQGFRESYAVSGSDSVFFAAGICQGKTGNKQSIEQEWVEFQVLNIGVSEGFRTLSEGPETHGNPYIS